MVNISGEIGPQNIKAVLKETEIRRVQPDVAFKAVGTQRPNANYREHDDRLNSLWRNRETNEHLSKEPVLPIEPSRKVISNDLELKPLLLGTLLASGSWKASFLSEYFGIKDPQEIEKRFGQQTKCNAKLRKMREDLGENEFLNRVSRYLDGMLNQAVAKEDKYKFGRLTVGLELEVVRGLVAEFLHVYKNTKNTQAKRIDSLQEVGLPISYDALREIPLPKSTSTHEQLKAFLLMFQSGLIEADNFVGIHLNLGGLRRLDSNLFLLQYMSTAAGLFQEKINPNREFHPLGEENRHWAKPLYEGDYSSSWGLPFVVRPNRVIEFRWLGECSNYMKYAKGLETFVYACEAIAAWQKVNDKYLNVTDKERQLASVWDRMKSQALSQFQTYQIDGAKYDYFEQDAEKCAALESQIMNRVATGNFEGELPAQEIEHNTKRRNEMYEVFREGRGEVKRILQEKPVSMSTDSRGTSLGGGGVIGG